LQWLRHGINLGIWSQWLYHETDKLALVVTVASIVTGLWDSCKKLVTKIKLNVSNDMYRNYLDNHTSDILVNAEHSLM